MSPVPPQSTDSRAAVTSSFCTLVGGNHPKSFHLSSGVLGKGFECCSLGEDFPEEKCHGSSCGFGSRSAHQELSWGIQTSLPWDSGQSGLSVTPRPDTARTSSSCCQTQTKPGFRWEIPEADTEFGVRSSSEGLPTPPSSGQAPKKLLISCRRSRHLLLVEVPAVGVT